MFTSWTADILACYLNYQSIIAIVRGAASAEYSYNVYTLWNTYVYIMIIIIVYSIVPINSKLTITNVKYMNREHCVPIHNRTNVITMSVPVEELENMTMELLVPPLAVSGKVRDTSTVGCLQQSPP